eukprot:Nitzschia sp. Nitz4//scaffold28_size193895//140111//141431//NITZ4_001677-RA/size193895-augustus-gene-0.312-mRNA-1//-1//CDS//3329546018//1554//frame0
MTVIPEDLSDVVAKKHPKVFLERKRFMKERICISFGLRSDEFVTESPPSEASAKRSRIVRNAILLSLWIHLFLLLHRSIVSVQEVPPWEESPLYTRNVNKTFALGGTELLNANSSLDIRAPEQSTRIPLEELILSDPDPSCNPGNSKKSLIYSTILPDGQVYSPNRRIPKIVHITCKTRCMTPKFIKTIAKWRFPGYAVYIHDDVAVDRLMAKYWPEFPHLQLFQKCSISGAAKADIWRLLVLWEYGGIYSDMDSAPGDLFQNASQIKDDDEAWFVVEKGGFLSQYFMASMPRHPLIHVTLITTLQRLLNIENIAKQYVPFVTGPGALKEGMMRFMKANEGYDKVKKGRYVGLDGRSVTVMGSQGSTESWIRREAVQGIHKIGGYTAMGMTHFARATTKTKDSCFELLYKETLKY